MVNFIVVKTYGTPARSPRRHPWLGCLQRRSSRGNEQNESGARESSMAEPRHISIALHPDGVMAPSHRAIRESVELAIFCLDAIDQPVTDQERRRCDPAQTSHQVDPLNDIDHRALRNAR